MNAFHEHVGGDEHLTVGVGEHGAVVAHSFQRRRLVWRLVFGETVDETELTQFFYLHSIRCA